MHDSISSYCSALKVVHSYVTPTANYNHIRYVHLMWFHGHTFSDCEWCVWVCVTDGCAGRTSWCRLIHLWWINWRSSLRCGGALHLQIRFVITCGHGTDVWCSMFNVRSQLSIRQTNRPFDHWQNDWGRSIHRAPQHHVSKTMSCHLWPHFCSKMVSKIKRMAKTIIVCGQCESQRGRNRDITYFSKWFSRLTNIDFGIKKAILSLSSLPYRVVVFISQTDLGRNVILCVGIFADEPDWAHNKKIRS